MNHDDDARPDHDHGIVPLTDLDWDWFDPWDPDLLRLPFDTDDLLDGDG